MLHRTLERAGAAGVALSLAFAAVAFADTTVRDADTLTVGAQDSRDLGDVTPGAVRVVSIGLELACSNFEHVDPGQSLLVGIGSALVPAGGSLAMDAVTLGPTPGSWSSDGEACAANEPIMAFGTVTIAAPASIGFHEYAIIFSRTLTPSGSNDASAIRGVTAATFTLTVVENTPPVLNLPVDMTVVGDSTGAWLADYAASATDAEDDPDPTPVCAPAIGESIPVGTTTVTCAATDSGGLETTGTFDIIVVPAPVEQEPGSDALPTAIFGPPIGTDGLDARVGRTIPIKVRLVAGDASVGGGVLILLVTPCDGGEPVTEVVMDWRADSHRWMGHLRTRGLGAGCYTLRATHDGVDVGGTELRLRGTPAAAAAHAASRAAKHAGEAKAKVPRRAPRGTGKGG